MSEIDKAEQVAMDQCLKALSSFRNGGTAAGVMAAIDALIYVRLAQFAEQMEAAMNRHKERVAKVEPLGKEFEAAIFADVETLYEA